MVTEIVLIRHGETDWNVERRYQGISDRPLNELGIRQAEALATAMCGEQWDVIISSPLKRAWNTAVPLATALGFSEDQIIPDTRLIERHYGVGEGHTLAEREQRYPGDTWEGLESLDELSVRALGAIDDYIQRFHDQRLIFVTHGTWINVVLTTLSHGEVGQGKSVILNTSRTYLTHSTNGWEIGEIGIADHLVALV